MTKMTISWHQECLENRIQHLKRVEQELERLKAEVERQKTGIAIYEYQIKEAIKEGKDGFDPDRFKKPRP